MAGESSFTCMSCCDRRIGEGDQERGAFGERRSEINGASKEESIAWYAASRFSELLSLSLTLNTKVPSIFSAILVLVSAPSTAEDCCVEGSESRRQQSRRLRTREVVVQSDSRADCKRCVAWRPALALHLLPPPFLVSSLAPRHTLPCPTSVMSSCRLFIVLSSPKARPAICACISAPCGSC